MELGMHPTSLYPRRSRIAPPKTEPKRTMRSSCVTLVNHHRYIAIVRRADWRCLGYSLSRLALCETDLDSPSWRRDSRECPLSRPICLQQSGVSIGDEA